MGNAEVNLNPAIERLVVEQCNERCYRILVSSLWPGSNVSVEGVYLVLRGRMIAACLLHW